MSEKIEKAVVYAFAFIGVVTVGVWLNATLGNWLWLLAAVLLPISLFKTARETATHAAPRPSGVPSLRSWRGDDGTERRLH